MPPIYRHRPHVRARLRCFLWELLGRYFWQMLTLIRAYYQLPHLRCQPQPQHVELPRRAPPPPDTSNIPPPTLHLCEITQLRPGIQGSWCLLCPQCQAVTVDWHMRCGEGSRHVAPTGWAASCRRAAWRTTINLLGWKVSKMKSGGAGHLCACSGGWRVWRGPAGRAAIQGQCLFGVRRGARRATLLFQLSMKINN